VKTGHHDLIVIPEDLILQLGVWNGEAQLTIPHISYTLELEDGDIF
jgi:hypothetical protein